MERLRRRQILGMSPVAAAAVVLLVAALFAVPPIYGQYLPQRLVQYLIFGLSALAVGLIAGRAQLLNIGVGATFGVAAYAVAMVSQHGVLNPLLLMLAALAAGVAISVLFAVFAVVATGIEYLLLTLLTTSAFFTLPLIFTGPTGGENGLAVRGPVTVSFGLDPLQGNGFYWLVCGVTVLWLGLSWYLLASRAGRVMTAIGRNPIRAAAMGYSVNTYRVAVTFYAGLIAASAGWLYALADAYVTQNLLGLSNSLNSVLYSLIGGVSSVIGPLLGTAVLRFLAEYAGQTTTQTQLYIGVALLVVVYLLPQGIVGALYRLGTLRRRIRGRPEDLPPGVGVLGDGLDAAIGQPLER